MDRLEHLGYRLHLGARRCREHVAIKVDGAPLVLGFGEYFSYSLQHTKTLVANHQFNPIQATTAEPLEEADPASPCPLSCPLRHLKLHGIRPH